MFPTFNSLQKDKILDWSKLKVLADNKIKVLKMMIFVSDRVENFDVMTLGKKPIKNIVGKGENAG